MEAKAILRNARIAPRKVSIVLDLIRGKDLEVALATVNHTPKAASEYLHPIIQLKYLHRGLHIFLLHVVILLKWS